MYNITIPTEIYVCTTPVDFRKSFNGLCGIVHNNLFMNTLDGALFVFYNKRRNSVKLLHWEGDGYSIYNKRLEAGTFEFTVDSKGCVALSWEELHTIFHGIELTSIKKRKRFERVA